MKELSPFDGAPKTRAYTDVNGCRAFIVKPLYLTPWRFKLTRFFTNVTAFTVMAASFVALDAADHEPNWAWIAAFIIPWVMAPFWFSLLRLVIGARKRIVLTKDSIVISGLFGDTSFDRRLDHKFSILQHDAARVEQRKHDLIVRREASKGRAVAKIPDYANSFHLSFDYLGQRNDLMTIYGQEEAIQVLSRLIACDGVLDAQAGIADGYATSPEDVWKPSPGDLS